MERKKLRKIFGPVKDNISGEWRRKKNSVLEILFHNRGDKKAKTSMGRPCLEEPKLINQSSTRTNPTWEKTAWKTQNKMGRLARRNGLQRKSNG